MDVEKTLQTIMDVAIVVGFKVVGAIVFWLIGRWLISLAVRLVSNALERQKVDPTLLRYLGTVISVTLNIKIANITAEPAPDVEVLEFNLNGPVLAVRPYCHTDHYWQVYFDTNKIIRETFGTAGYPVPEQHFVVRNPQ